MISLGLGKCSMTSNNEIASKYSSVNEISSNELFRKSRPLEHPKLIADGFNKPLFVTSLPEDANILYVVEQGGRIKIIKNGHVLDEAFLDIDKQVVIESVLPDEVEKFPWTGHLGTKLLPKIIPIINQSKTTLLFTNTSIGVIVLEA